MNLRIKTISAARFKAGCLALLERVARTGEAIVVTKRGRPVAKVVPFTRAAPTSLRSSVTFRGDIVGPILEAWEMDK